MDVPVAVPGELQSHHHASQATPIEHQLALPGDGAHPQDDRIRMLFAAVHESAFGPKRTRRWATAAAAFGGKADTKNYSRRVRF